MKNLCFLIFSLLLFISCTTQPTTSIISLTNLQPLPMEAATEVVPLRVAIAAVISPKGNVDSYGPLLDYLSEEMNRPVELVQRRTYAEINELIKSGEVDIAFVCTSAYVAGVRDFDMELLVAPQVQSATEYYSLLIVPQDSTAQSMVDLRDGLFAFTDPMSNSGRNYPTLLVQELGETTEQFFSQTFFTYSHDDAIRAVANHVADGAAVDSLVYEYAISREPELGEKIRVIHRSPPFGIPPVVVGPHVRPQQRADLQNVLLQMDVNENGRLALASAGIDKFVLIEDDAYDSVRLLEAQTRATNEETVTP